MSSKKIDICIYCGAVDDLTKEHIVPKALAGDVTLLNASCKDCAKVTSRFETFLLKRPIDGAPGMLCDLRYVLGAPSRKGSTRGVKLRQLKEHIETGRQEEEMVDSEGYVGVVMLPLFKEPGYVTGISYPNGIELEGLKWVSYVSNKDKAQKGYRYGSQSKSREGDFPRLLAKIAYCAAVYHLGYERVKNSPLKSLILANSPDQARWIGCDPNNTILGDNLGLWAFEVGNYKGHLAAKIKLMAFSPKETPEYVVIVVPDGGRLLQETKRTPKGS